MGLFSILFPTVAANNRVAPKGMETNFGAMCEDKIIKHLSDSEIARKQLRGEYDQPIQPLKYDGWDSFRKRNPNFKM